MLHLAARSGAEGRRAGLLPALGISAGCMVHVLGVFLGLGVRFALLSH